jgi:hypothetical protein
MFSASLIGMGVGPVAVASLTMYLFRDEHAVGKSLSLVTEAASIVCFVLLTLALKTAAKDRGRVLEAERGVPT